VGARNFPKFGSDGEDAFRDAFDDALINIGATVPNQGVVVDLGCGCGTSARRIGQRYKQCQTIYGIDLSPYFIGVGKALLELAPKGHKEGGNWVTTIHPDDRIDLRLGDATNTNLPDNSVDVVNLSLVIHEMPISITCQVIDEAFRILKNGGQIWISEMDFDSPAYAAQRSNALLFSLLRATEPFLDEYADGCEEIRSYMLQNFGDVRITAATGRHYALVATKDRRIGQTGGEKSVGVLYDTRFNSDGEYAVDDTHLKVWESKDDDIEE